MTAPGMESQKYGETARGLARWASQMLAGLVIFGVILFVCAGRLNWRAGWGYLIMNLLTQALSALVLIPRRPEMLADRSQVREGTKSWDRILAPAITFAGTFPVIILAGLDARFGWSTPLDTWIWVVALVNAFAC